MIQKPNTTVKSPVCLVAVSEYGEFHAMLVIARGIEENLGLHPLFVFSSGYGNVPLHGQLVEYNGYSWMELGGFRSSRTTPDDVLSERGYFHVSPGKNELASQSLDNAVDADSSRVTVPFWVRQLLASEYLGHKLHRRFFPNRNDNGSHLAFSLQRQIRAAAKIFELYDVRLIVSGQDYALSVTSILAHAGASKNVRLAVVPYSMPPTTREIVESFARLRINRVRKGWEPFLKRRFSKWLMSYRGVTYSRLHPLEILQAERLGLAPPLPWTPNSGSGYLLLSSPQAMDYYWKSGIDPNRMIVTGATWNDELLALEPSRAERKQKLLHRIQTELSASNRQVEIPSGRIVIVSWPPNQWPRAAMGCDSYEDLCRQFIASLAAIQTAQLAYVGVSLHPTVSDPLIINGLRRAGIVVLRESLLKVIDCADAFSATVSSTAFWAIQCGIPTINFDGYLYGYREFDEAGMITVQTANQLRAEVDRLLSDQARYSAVEQRILATRDYWTHRKGNSNERIMAEFAKLAKCEGSVRSEC